MLRKLLFNKRARAFIPLAAAAALALGVAGCGSDDDGEAALTKAQLIKQGNAICVGAEEAQSEASAKYAKAHPQVPEERPEVEEAISAMTLPALRKSTEELEALNPPAADEEELDLILASIKEGTEKIEEDPILVLTGKGDPFGKANQLASEYGLEACSELP